MKAKYENNYNPVKDAVILIAALWILFCLIIQIAF